ncbi:MAG: PH domain-containing protein [Proteobacteria bacterium]|nr:PH domain-containing protein [Pseudomonadota bacterium]
MSGNQDFNSTPPVQHFSKRDGWLGAIIWASVIVLAVLAVVAVSLSMPLAPRAILVLLYVGTAAFALWVWYFTGYRVQDGTLLVRSGPFKWRVPLDGIREVAPSRSWRSSPACSLDRLEIKHPGGSILVSPADKDRFMDDLALRSPGLVRAGDRLTRD